MPDTGGRVPPGTDFSWVKAKLNAVDVIFLNRQLQELLTYIDVLLAMQPPPNAAPLPQVNNKSRGGSGRSTPGGGRQTSRTHSRRSSRDFLDMLQSRVSFTEERGGESGSGHRQSGKPSNNALRVLLDVDMRAPVITMPLSSFSDDEVEVDLGHLQLTNRIVYEVSLYCTLTYLFSWIVSIPDWQRHYAMLNLMFFPALWWALYFDGCHRCDGVWHFNEHHRQGRA